MNASSTAGVPGEILNFYTEILESQRRAKRTLEGHLSVNLDEADIGDRVRARVPLLDVEKLNVEENALEGIFADIYAILRKYGKEGISGAAYLMEATREGRLALRDLVKAAIGGDAAYFERLCDEVNRVDEVNVEKESLLFLAREIGRPLFELYAERLSSKIDEAAWDRGSCPICGNDPALAKLTREEGRRMLWCSFCGTEWPYGRIRCPFCSNDDHRTLRYFFFDEEGPYRVDVCEKCRRYLKTIDERKISEDKEVNLPLEYMVTLDLDVIAEEEGYGK